MKPVHAQTLPLSYSGVQKLNLSSIGAYVFNPSKHFPKEWQNNYIQINNTRRLERTLREIRGGSYDSSASLTNFAGARSSDSQVGPPPKSVLDEIDTIFFRFGKMFDEILDKAGEPYIMDKDVVASERDTAAPAAAGRTLGKRTSVEIELLEMLKSKNFFDPNVTPTWFSTNLWAFITRNYRLLQSAQRSGEKKQQVVGKSGPPAKKRAKHGDAVTSKLANSNTDTVKNHRITTTVGSNVQPSHAVVGCCLPSFYDAVRQRPDAHDKHAKLTINGLPFTEAGVSQLIAVIDGGAKESDEDKKQEIIID